MLSGWVVGWRTSQPQRLWLVDWWLSSWLSGWVVGWRTSRPQRRWLVDWWLGSWLSGRVVGWRTSRPQRLRNPGQGIAAAVWRTREDPHNLGRHLGQNGYGDCGRSRSVEKGRSSPGSPAHNPPFTQTPHPMPASHDLRGMMSQERLSPAAVVPEGILPSRRAS